MSAPTANNYSKGDTAGAVGGRDGSMDLRSNVPPGRELYFFFPITCRFSSNVGCWMLDVGTSTLSCVDEQSSSTTGAGDGAVLYCCGVSVFSRSMLLLLLYHVRSGFVLPHCCSVNNSARFRFMKETDMIHQGPPP